MPTVTEREAQTYLRMLPRDSFIYRYCHYAHCQTDAPLAYHPGVAFSILAASAPMEHKLWFATWMQSNIWILLVGESGRTRKTSAMDIGEDILRDVDASLIGDEPSSQEGLIESLALQNKQLLYFPEFGDFLAKTERGYLGPLRPLLTKLYDCKPCQRRLARTVTYVEKPRVSILGGCTPAFLEKWTNPTDYTGGFMSRLCTLVAERERTITRPGGMFEYRPWLIDRLSQIAATEPAVGVGFTDEAGQYWERWYLEINARYKGNTHRTARGAAARTHTMALKACLLMQLDFGVVDAQGQWYITLPMLKAAIAFAEMHLKSVIWIAENLCGDRWQQDRRNVLEAMGNRRRSLGTVIRRARMSKRRVSEVLETLHEEGTIARYKDPGTNADTWQVVPQVEVDLPDNVLPLHVPSGSPGSGTPAAESRGPESELPSPEELRSGLISLTEEP